MDNWISVEEKLPPKGEVVDTKIQGPEGSRMEQQLKLGGMKGNMWFIPDGSMYVYYNPTHWKAISHHSIQL